jgi:hypothetical protein
VTRVGQLYSTTIIPMHTVGPNYTIRDNPESYGWAISKRPPNI